MKPAHFLLHVVQSQPRAQSRDAVAQAFAAHVKKTFSREQLSKTIREQVLKERKARAVQEQLNILSRELAAISSTHGERVFRLQRRMKEMQENLQKR